MTIRVNEDHAFPGLRIETWGTRIVKGDAYLAPQRGRDVDESIQREARDAPAQQVIDARLANSASSLGVVVEFR